MSARSIPDSGENQANCFRPLPLARPPGIVLLNPNSVMDNARTQSQAAGARRFRPLSVPVVLHLREAQVEGTSKRPEGRAPFVPHDLTSVFKLDRFLSGPLSAVHFLLLTGCQHLGPKTVVGDRFDYRTALADSWKQQMLLNIVKLRYLDLPVFVDVAPLVSGSSMQTGVSVNGTRSSEKAIQDNYAAIGGQAICTERPTKYI